jgi:hypothetical protein
MQERVPMSNILENGLRRQLNLRPRKDDDLLQLLVDYGLDKPKSGDFAHFCRELMRDGMRFRGMKVDGRAVVYRQPARSVLEEMEEES